MSDEIIKILDDLAQRFGIAIDWSSKNIIPYLQDLMQRFINYEVLTSIIYIIIGIILCVGSIIVFVKSNSADILGPILIILIVFGIFIMIVVQVFDIITCYTIPEKIIYEHLHNTLNLNR